MTLILEKKFSFFQNLFILIKVLLFYILHLTAYLTYMQSTS